MCGISLYDHILSLFRSGKIWIEGREVIGIASDESEVSLFEASNIDLFDERNAFFDYIASHPTPDTW